VAGLNSGSIREIPRRGWRAHSERQGAISSRSHYLGTSLSGPTLVERGNDILLRLQELAYETLHFVQLIFCGELGIIP